MIPVSAHNIEFVGHTDQNGRGDGVQVMVHKGHAFVGHMFSDGVTVLDAAERPVARAAVRLNWGVEGERYTTETDADGRFRFAQARPGKLSAGAMETIKLLEQIVSRLGVEGRLRMSVERATALVHAAGVGVVLTLIPTPPKERDSELSTVARDSVLSAITTDKKAPSAKGETITTRAVALREAIRRADKPPLTAAERDLLLEWLARLGD